MSARVTVERERIIADRTTGTRTAPIKVTEPDADARFANRVTFIDADGAIVAAVVYDGTRAWIEPGPGIRLVLDA